MGLYDWFSAVYDPLVSPLYREHRQQAVAALELSGGERVLDLACGTGENVPWLLDALGDGGEVLGVDLSAGMLSRATRRFGDDSRVRFLQRDATQLTDDDVGQVDAAICFLGLTVMPEPKAVVAATLRRLKPGGRFVIYDIHAERWVPQTTMVQCMAGADLSRKVWEPLQANSTDFSLRQLPGSAHVYGGACYLAAGVAQ